MHADEKLTAFAGWSWGCVSAIDSNGQTIWIADAHCDNGKRFVVHADEKLTAFVATRIRFALAANWFDECRFFFKLDAARNLGQGEEALPAAFFPLSRLAVARANPPGKRKEESQSTMHQTLKLIRLIVPLVVCFALAPIVQAVGPDTDGSIPGANNGEGVGVLVSRTTGIWNTGTGFEALNHLTAGNQNTATGLRALFSDINGGFNTATGVYSLYSNTSGFYNSATGAYSLTHNTTGNNNTATGYSALYFNTEGNDNTATGFAALYRNTTGTNNTATGEFALSSNRTGNLNTAHGLSALYSNTTGNGNTAEGGGALVPLGGNNTAIDRAL